MSIKLIVTDMDGTLLNENVEITNRATEAIFKAQKAGLDFAIATGRTVNSGYSLAKKQGVTCPFIELNGARMFNGNEELQFTRAIDKKNTESLINILEQYDVHSEFITQDETFSNKTTDEYIETFKHVFQSINKSLTDDEALDIIQDRLSNLNIQTVDNYDFLTHDPSVQVLKTIVNISENLFILNDIQKEIEDTLPELIVTSASSNNIEINNRQANKGKAVAEYAASQGYKPSEVITIGDNINDLTMLEWADHSYAVSNAHTETKDAATYLAPSHTEDAVAQIIERVLDGKSLRF